jgi:hypothetical protein
MKVQICEVKYQCCYVAGRVRKRWQLFFGVCFCWWLAVVGTAAAQIENQNSIIGSALSAVQSCSDKVCNTARPTRQSVAQQAEPSPRTGSEPHKGKDLRKSQTID